MSSPITPDQLELQGQKKVQKYLEQGGKLRTLNRVTGFLALDAHRRRTDKNIEAEDAAARRALFGEKDNPKASDDMGQFILGDVTNPTPIVVNSPPQQQGSGLGKVLAGAAMGAALLGVPFAGVAGFALSKLMSPPAPVVPTNPTEDTTVDIGLRRIEDLFPGGVKP